MTSRSTGRPEHLGGSSTNGSHEAAGILLPQADPIAIVGIGCRFAGGVTDPRSFWNFLVEGRDAITEVPADRFDVDAFYDPRPATPGKVLTRWGGFLDQIEHFDARFFGISPREAERLDPQQRLLLEVAWEALEDGGQRPDRLDGKQTGVFIGIWFGDYEARLFQDPSQFDFYMHTGSGRYFASGRLSYAFGLEGPSLSLDTGCSSSLVAVHLACQSLRSGECDLAIAGGANIILQPHMMIALSQEGIICADGRCKFGDARADGYVRSEGAAVVVLKPLARALADGDPIYALIRGSAVSNDGRSSGFLATPGSEGQEETLRRAYRNAGVRPDTITYIEAHGTGTRAGDPVELRAIGNVLATNRPAERPCLVGSHKTNFGHTEGAAGIAGLIKTALAVKHRTIPASLNFDRPNPSFAWDDYQLVIPSETVPWPADAGPALAGVSSIGLAGTNAHVVLEEAPAIGSSQAAATAARPRLLTIFGQTPAARTEVASRLQSFLAEEVRDEQTLDDICYTACARRAHLDYRLAVVGRDQTELIDRLASFVREGEGPGLAVGRAAESHRVVFVFPGQGSQWLGMGRQLLANEPVFRQALEACAVALAPYVDDWSLLDELAADESTSQLERIDVLQPAVFAIQVALAALWKSWGVVPDAVIGHSLGEIAAAYVAGVLSLDEACRVIGCRSRLLRRISGQGTMAVVGLSFVQAQAALIGYEDRLSIAVSNSARSTVISGDSVALAELMAGLEQQNIFCRGMKVDVAGHSPQVDPLLDELATELATLQPQRPTLPFFSTVTGTRADEIDFDAGYWVRNIRQSVLFSTTVKLLLDDGYETFVELSPHPSLLQALELACRDQGRPGQALPSLRDDEDEQAVMLGSLGALHTTGYPVDWAKLYPTGGNVCPLPTYAWQRERYWVETRSDHGSAQWSANGNGQLEQHPLLGLGLPELAPLAGSSAWQRTIDYSFARKLLGRQEPVGDQPAVASDEAYRELALAAARARFGNRPHAVNDLTVHEPLVLNLDPDDGRMLQSVLTTESAARASLQVFSRGSTDTSWTRHAAADLTISRLEPDWLYSLEWRPRARQSVPAELSAETGGYWVIFGDQGQIGTELIRQMAQRGETTVRVEPGDSFAAPTAPAGPLTLNPGRREDFVQLIDHLSTSRGPACRGVVYLWGTDLPDTARLTADSLQRGQLLGIDSLLHLTQALNGGDWSSSPRLWVVTSGAESVAAVGETSVAVTQAPLWGLGRVIGLEHPELWGGLLDLPPDANGSGSAAERIGELVAEICAPDGEDQIAYRDRERYVARLVRSPIQEVGSEPLELRADATYLISGGLGSLGLHLARWLVERGARHLVLTSRDGLPERATWDSLPAGSALRRRAEAVQALERRGATVTVARADVTDPARMAALLAELGQTRLPLRGIIHAAGAITHHAIADLTPEAVEEILRPKVAGAWALHELTLAPNQSNQDLDFFVCFSSGAAIWGSQGLAHYAAANHFMDALAQHRRTLGLPALSVNWGSWAGEGMAAGELAGAFNDAGLGALPPEAALDTLAYLLQANATQQVVAAFDWPRFRPIYEARRERRLIQEIEAIAAPAAPGEPRRSELLDQLEQALPSERLGLITTHVRAAVAQILGFAQVELLDLKQGFFKMGMDSIMTVRLRGQLEAGIGRSLPPTVAFEYPTVEGLSAYLANEVLADLASGGPTAQVDQVDQGEDLTLTDLPSPEADRQELNQLSDEELLALFDREFESASEYVETN